MIFAAVFTFSSCGNGKDKSKIIIISEETFKSEIKTKDWGSLEEEFSPKKLSKSEVDYLQNGKKYYALVYLHKVALAKGRIEITGNTKTDITLENGYSMLGVNNHYHISLNESKDGYDVGNYGKKISESTHYGYFSFTVNSFDGLESSGADELNIKLSYSSEEGATELDKEVAVTKELRSEKKLNAASSIKYLTEEGFESGKYDENLKDTLEVAQGEKFYVVVDYTLSGGVKIEDTDTAAIYISISADKIDLWTGIEELPTSDYTVTDGVIKSTIRIFSGTSESKVFRFIVAVMPEEYEAGDGLNINIKSTISATNISFSGKKQANNTVTVNPSLSATSKFDFSLSPDGKYYILTGIGEETRSYITIPSWYNNLPVERIGKEAFLNYTFIKEIKLSTRLKVVEEGAFKGCTGIKSMVIPENVTYIGNDAFSGITDIEIYCETYSPSYISFSDQESLYVTWNYGDDQYLLNEDKASYTYYYGGTSVNLSIPETYKGLPVTAIAENSFNYCSKLKKIKIPKTVTEIPENAFDNCKSLEKIDLSAENPVYKCVGNCLIDVKSQTLITGCNNSVIPNDGSVTVIREYAFYCREGLESIAIPDSVTKIGKEAFRGCAGISEITVGNGVKIIGEKAFYGCSRLNAVNFDEGCDFSQIGENAFYGTAYYLNQENWQSGALYIGKILIKANNIAGATIKNGTVYIADFAFKDCTEITEITIPQSVKVIGKYTFKNCCGLLKVVISDGVTYINTGAFSSCEKLKTVIIPISVTTIGDFAFSNCKLLTDVKYRGTKEHWDKIEKLFGWNSLDTVNTINFTVTYNYTGE